MAYDEGLAQRLRVQLRSRRDVSERKMFGGICFMVRGHMCVGIVKQKLMARVGPERHAEALEQPHTRTMDFTHRPMQGYVFVEPAGYATDADLAAWVKRTLDFNATLPAK